MRRSSIPVIKRSAHVWKPSQQMTKGVSGAKFFTLKKCEGIRTKNL